ncbi:hypothetical protein GCM10010399_83790 [Dactylosporangium fulvum]|uniref:Resolvase/invertase-type recombinase catalytic domain-containing protein n=1 Tax=Dactylosporangium fulvum TaxID=53359 RepID=A0ABY5VSK3_9ACTN|nr:hypothetical protein [Dactylosporangium fulvum]UWP80545.1 hypothetical protein Dfulv_36065 [Dactylosporangium fulvum]
MFERVAERAPSPPPRPSDTTDPARVFAALDADPTNINVTQESLPRALQLIRLLAAEASKRGHRVGVNTKTKHPRAYLQIGQARRAVTLTEEYDRSSTCPPPRNCGIYVVARG